MYFQEDSPLLLEKAALLFDRQKEINIFQGRFINMQNKSISAVYIDIGCFDISGKKLGIVQGIYLDMDTPQNVSFGDNVPVEIPYLDARKFAFRISKIAFTDGEIKEYKLQLYKVAKAKSFSSIVPYKEQYIREINNLNPKVECRNILVSNKIYWLCPCGTLNTRNSNKCRNCNLSIDKLKVISDISYLNQRQMEYEEKMQKKKQIIQQQEEERLRQLHIRNKKLVKLFSVCTVAILFVFLMANYVFLPQYYCGKAEEYINNRDFDSAEKSYQNITSQLRKSKETEGYYKYCVKFLGENDIENAEKCYKRIQDTEKVKDDKLNNLWKDACIKEVNNSDNMLLCYSHIKNQNVLKNKELNDTFMKCGKKLLIDMDFENATSLYLSKVAEEYSTSLENIYYESAMQLIEKGNYMEAIDNCYGYISEQHIDELSKSLKNAYIASIDGMYSYIDNFCKLKKYLSKEEILTIKNILYSQGKQKLNVNENDSFSEHCFSQIEGYKDSNEYSELLKNISNENLTQRYKIFNSKKSSFAKEYIKNNKDIQKYRKICGEWMANGEAASGWVIIVNISLDKGAHIVYYFNEKDYRKGKKFSDITEDICYKSGEFYEELWEHKIKLTDSGKLRLRFDDGSGYYICSRR